MNVVDLIPPIDNPRKPKEVKNPLEIAGFFLPVVQRWVMRSTESGAYGDWFSAIRPRGHRDSFRGCFHPAVTPHYLVTGKTLSPDAISTPDANIPVFPYLIRIFGAVIHKNCGKICW